MNSLLIINLVFPVGLPSTESVYNSYDFISIARNYTGHEARVLGGKQSLRTIPRQDKFTHTQEERSSSVSDLKQG